LPFARLEVENAELRKKFAEIEARNAELKARIAKLEDKQLQNEMVKNLANFSWDTPAKSREFFANQVMRSIPYLM
jgi:cell division protein FtsB